MAFDEAGGGNWLRHSQIRAGTMCSTQMLKSGDPVAERLLADEPPGHYLLEYIGGRFFMWRLSEGEPDDEALEPATGWPWLAAVVA